MNETSPHGISGERATPLVSVIIPTYNHAHFLGRALQSVLDQTHPNWEAIVIDNHSQDNTDEIVRSYRDPRITLLKIHNKGVISASRNMGIRAARGEWIAFLDSDDFWYPAKLEHCLAKLNEGFDLVCHGERWLGEGRDRKMFYGPEARASYHSLLFDGNCISTSAVVVSREHVEAAGGFDEDPNVITAEDYDLWLRLARNGARIGFVHEILGEYLIHGGNQSKAVLRNMEAVMCVVRKHLADLEVDTLAKRLSARRREAIVYYSGARGLQDNGQHGEAWPYFWRALSAWPFPVKFYAAMVLNALHRRLV
jgi:glycosyltransferase involved in cell wall biosynthesis